MREENRVAHGAPFDTPQQDLDAGARTERMLRETSLMRWIARALVGFERPHDSIIGTAVTVNAAAVIQENDV